MLNFLALQTQRQKIAKEENALLFR
ncbi:excinuclease ABC subunit B [Rhodobacterales bacterium HTCC2150]|nr:excinuclease ABC subunit B [Rhodobacterales bacterium HTCC2150] [Rhodobacteraceae bacterium HTCC2150]